MTETQLKIKVLKYLKSIPNSYTMKLSDRWVAGYPDVLFILNGKAIFFELKSPTGKVTKLQFWTMEQLHKAGAETYVIYELEQVKKILDKVKNL